MTDDEALLAAIVAAPDDDLPRLVYADWLDEHGRPDRAEFIRAQVERERLTPADPRYRVLALREAALFGRHRHDWTAAIKAVLPGAAAAFRRGFVDELTAPAAELLTNAADVWLLAPLRRVTAGRSVVVIPDLSHLPRPSHVRLSAGLMDDVRQDGLCPLDLLAAGAAQSEPWVRAGRWLVLAWPDNGRGRRAVTQFAELIRRRTRRGWGLFVLSMAARPLQENDDTRGWCRLSLPTGEPTWLLFRDGDVVSRQTGGERMIDIRDEFWEPVGGPTWFFR